MKDPVSILLVDDHALFRESLARLLESEPEFHVAGLCATTTEALQCLDVMNVDVILLDYDLGQESGSDILEKLCSLKDPVKVLMVTAGMSDAVARNALEQGAAGIVLKHSGPGQLIEAIRRVARGEMWLDSATLQSLFAARGEARKSSPASLSLTSRQQEVLRGILDGLTNKEIAAQMQTSESSIKAAIQELFQKAGVRTRSQLVRIAFEKHSADWLDSKL